MPWYADGMAARDYCLATTFLKAVYLFCSLFSELMIGQEILFIKIFFLQNFGFAFKIVEYFAGIICCRNSSIFLIPFLHFDTAVL